MTKEAVKQEVEKLLKAESLCPEGQEAVKAYLKAYGTAEEKSKELKEDICGIDDLIHLAGTDLGKQIFGEEGAKKTLKAAEEAKEKGEDTCLCAACQGAKIILENEKALLS